MQLPTRILSSCLALTAAVAARAQFTPPPGDGGDAVALETLRVTADLWASPLDRIPASVTVLDAAALEAGAVRHFGDLVDRVPNLTWNGATSRPRYLQIRGVGENSQFEGETPDASVRFLVDDFDFTGLGTLGSTFDVDQVEVLRGPQAGAFGANAAGGVVRLVTRAPTPFWSGVVEGTVAGDDTREGGFAMGGPLLAAQPERLMMRLAVHQHVSDGFRRNLTVNDDTNARDEFSARLRLAWDPGALWQWEAGLLWSDVDNDYDEFALDNNGRFTYSDQPGRDTQESLAASLRGTYSGWQAVRLTTVTSGAWIDSIYSYDDDWTAASYAGFSDLRRDRSVFNQELRLDAEAGASGGIDRWTVGVFLSGIDESSAYTNEDPGNVRGLRTRYETRQAALFGQVGRPLAPGTRLVLGLRAERVDTEGRGTRWRWRKGPGTFDPERTFRPAFDDELWGGKIALEHTLGANGLAFASITRGYKAGGINIDARINPPADPLTYATETLWNYELGLRGHLLEERLRGEVTMFYLDRSRTQVRDSAGFGGNYRFFTANGDDAHVYGAEAAVSYTLAQHTTVHASLGWMESELDAFTLANGNVGGGRRLANTPRYGYTLGVRTGAPTGWFGRAEWAGRAEQYDSNNHDEARRAFQVVDASVGYAWARWTLTLWGRNLGNEEYDKRVYFFGNAEPDYAETRYETRADPRQVGVTASYRY